MKSRFLCIILAIMKKTSFHIIELLVAFCWLFCPPAQADWINISGAQNAPNIAEIYINDDHVRIELEIFVNDMVTFDRLIPDQFFEGSQIKRPALADHKTQKKCRIDWPSYWIGAGVDCRQGGALSLFKGWPLPSRLSWHHR